MPLSYRMLQIAGSPAGLLGLDELFNELTAAGIDPADSQLASLLLDGIKKHNYIPKPAENGYSDVLKREYERFWQRQQSGKPIAPRNYGTWRGYPREQIPWFPTITRELCNDCGACMEICARNVFERDQENHVWVAEPFLCMVGCCFCKSACEPKALFFPKQEMLKDYREKM